jgi:hypothetical protein
LHGTSITEGLRARKWQINRDRLTYDNFGFQLLLWDSQKLERKKGSPVHVAPACAGSGEGSDHFGSYVRSLYLHFCKRLFPGLDPTTSWSQGQPKTAPHKCFTLQGFRYTNKKICQIIKFPEVSMGLHVCPEVLRRTRNFKMITCFLLVHRNFIRCALLVLITSIYLICWEKE